MTADELAKLLDALGQRLGPTGQHVFELAVRQQVIDGLVLLVGCAGLVVIAAIVSVVVRWRIRIYNLVHPDETDESHIGLGWKALSYGIIWSVAILFSVFVAGGAISKLLNPEYAAIRDILSAIGGAK